MIKLSVQVSYKKQATLGIIGITILLLAIEVIANVWWIAQINCEFEQNEIFQNFDEVEKRQLCLDLYNLKTSGNEIIPDQDTGSITINSLGFRGSEFSTVKPTDTYRIFMIGGSTMFGAGATSDETTIPGYVQQFLNENNPKFDVDVINAGIQGADSNTELKLIEQKLIKFSPDLTIIYDGWNDLRASNMPDALKENWESMCELGKENNFDVIKINKETDYNLGKLSNRLKAPNTTYGDKVFRKEDPKEILDECNVIVAIRPGFRPSDIPHRILQKVHFANIPRFELSSSKIRSRWVKDLTIRYMVTLPIWKYINENNLYSSKG